MPGANLGTLKRKIINQDRLARTGSLFNLADGRNWHKSSPTSCKDLTESQDCQEGPATAIRSLGTTNGLLDLRQFQ